MKELEFIKKIKKKTATSGGGLVLGIGDDCAVIEKDENNFFVWASDMITEGSHFRAKDGYSRIGRKAVAVNISDVAAMGAVPKYITVSIGIPPRMKMTEALKVYDGIHSICREYGILIAGGDTVRSSKLTIDVSVIGIVKKKEIITRSGAEEGDLILITGPVRDGKKEHLDFTPRFEESRFLARKHRPGAMIDVSDGIALDVSRVCEASGTGCLLYAENIPLSQGLTLKDALYYGESFELLFTMSVEKAQKLPSRENNKGLAGFFVIGVVTRRSKGMKIVGVPGKTRDIELKGYDHFTPDR
jgi:thiamine-monophosphate kinase